MTIHELDDDGVALSQEGVLGRTRCGFSGTVAFDAGRRWLVHATGFRTVRRLPLVKLGRIEMGMGSLKTGTTVHWFETTTCRNCLRLRTTVR